jgi:PBP/GOBP family
LISVGFLILQVCADEWRVQTAEDLGGYRTECVKDLGVPEERVAEFKSWKFDETYDKTECYMKCMFVKMGLFTEETGFNVRRT